MSVQGSKSPRIEQFFDMGSFTLTMYANHI
jgi:hypothetical protein